MRDPGDRTVVISDTHLGRPDAGAGSPEALRPLWADATELIINGDVAELCDPVHRAAAARHVVRLQELCAADGVRLTMLSGNHDPLLTDCRQLSLRDGEVFLTHGDVLHPAISPWNADAENLRRFNEQALAMLDRETRADFLSQLAASQHAAAAEWDAATRKTPARMTRAERAIARSRRAAAALWYWHTLPKRAAQFVAKHAPEARFFVFGHVHRAGIWTIDGRVIINTGSYGFVLKPRAVVIEGNSLSVWPVLLTPDKLYSLGNYALATYGLRKGSAEQDVAA